ncbi:MAG: acyltransferase [Lachnospiraceae bacterium]
MEMLYRILNEQLDSNRKIVCYGKIEKDFLSILNKESLYIKELTELQKMVCSDKESYFFLIDKWTAQIEEMLVTAEKKEYRDFVYIFPQVYIIKGMVKEYHDKRGNVIRNLPNGVTIRLYGYGAEADFKNCSGNVNVELWSDSKLSVQDSVLGSSMQIRCYRNAFISLQEDRFNGGENEIFVYPNGNLVIGKNCTFNKRVHIDVGAGKKCMIGEDCMFSWNVTILASDGHAIFDSAEKDRVNGKCMETIIGSHVWIGAQSMILNGSNIGSGSIVGSDSVVTKEFPPNVSIGGNPAKVLNKNRSWDRNNGVDVLNQKFIFNE